MRKLNLADMQNRRGGAFTPNWADCSFLTAAAVVTFVVATPAGGAVLGGIAAGCWHKAK